MSGLVGLLFRVLLGHKAWIARPLAVATSIALLALTASPFPPGLFQIKDITPQSLQLAALAL